MKGKNILVTAACVIGFGGIIGNTLVGVATSRELNKKINENNAKNNENIDKVAQDAKEADDAYKASTVAELKAYVNQTRDSINQANEAARNSLLAGIAALQNKIDAVKEELEAEANGANEALRTQLIAQLNQLVEQVQNALNLLGDDIDAVRAAANEIAQNVTVLQNKVTELEETMGQVTAAIGQIANYLGELYSAAANLGERMEAAEANLTALEARLDGDYYTVAEINAYLGQMNGALNGIIAYLTVDGNVMTMESIDERVAALETLSSALDTDMEAFNGTEATAAKAQYVQDLFGIIAAYDHDVLDTYNEIVEGYDYQGLSVPGYITDLKDALLDSDGLAELKDKMMVAMTRIILAPTKEDAKAVRDEYAGNVEYEIDALSFELDRINASNEVYDMIDYTYWEFNTDVFDVFNDVIMAEPFDNADEDDKAAYYEEKQAKIAFEVARAQGYKDLLDALNADLDILDSYAHEETPTRDTTYDMLEYFYYRLDDLSYLDDYLDGIDGLDEAEIETFVDSLIADADFVMYAADKLDVLVKAGIAADDAINNATTGYALVLDTIDTDIAVTISEAIADAVVQTAYEEAYDAAKGNATDLDARKALIDEYIDGKLADCTYEVRVAKYLVDVKQASVAAQEYVDDRVNLTADQKDVLSTYLEEAEVPTLADVYEATGKDSEERFETEEEFAALLEVATANIEAVKTIALAQDGMNLAAANAIGPGINTKAASVAANPDTLIQNAVAEAPNFVAYVEGAYDYYEVVSDTEIKGLDADHSILDIAEVATANKEACATDCGLASGSYSTYIDILLNGAELNDNIDTRIDTLTSLFTIANNNSHHDGDAVLADYADDIAALVDLYTVVDTGTPTVTKCAEYDDTADYAVNQAAMQAFAASLEESDSTVADMKTNFENDANALQEEMVQAYKDAEAARLESEKVAYLGEDKDGASGALRDLYVAVLAKADASTFANAEMIFNATVDAMQKATLSDDIERIYNGAMVKFAEKCFGFTGTDAEKIAQLEAELA